jgi:uncharacterized membrane protein
MRKHLGSVMGIGRRIGLEDENGHVLPVFLALVVVAAVVAGLYYFVIAPPQPESYNTMYLLDSQNQANNFPEVLVADQNSTFSVTVGVTNHMNKTQDYQVRTKITTSFIVTPQGGVAVDPVNTYDFNLPNGDTYEKSVSLTENTVGTYTVVFELWQRDDLGAYVFTQNYCVLNIKVIS